MLGKLNKAGSAVLSLYDDFKEFLAPSACLCCGRDRDFADPFICPDCVLKLKSANIGNGPVCPLCGRPSGAGSPCDFCGDKNAPQLFFWGIYENELQECLLQFKFHRALGLGKHLTEMALEPLFDRLQARRYDTIIPVPLHRSRERERNYNQSQIISETLASRLHIQHEPHLLHRKRHTQQQAKLEESHRWENVKDAFEVDGDSQINGSRILLVDDIVTTGATVYEASRPLLNAGAAHLDIFSLAYAK
jgi:ComF family protein